MVSFLLVVLLCTLEICVSDNDQGESCGSSQSYQQEMGDILKASAKIMEATAKMSEYMQQNPYKKPSEDQYNDPKMHDDSELILWLKKNNFHQVIPTFQRESITLNELISMGEDTEILRQYLNELNISPSLITRITFKINQMLKNNKENTNTNKDRDSYKHKQTKGSSIKEELAKAMIPNHKLPEYKMVHHDVLPIIKKIAPSSRSIAVSFTTVTMQRDKIDAYLPSLLRQVAVDLNTEELDEELVQIFEANADYAKWGSRTAKKRYSRVDLNVKYDGKTYFIAGAIGFQQSKHDKNEVEFGAALYQEVWKENWTELFMRLWSSRETAREALGDSKIEKFAMYEMYQRLV